MPVPHGRPALKRDDGVLPDTGVIVFLGGHKTTGMKPLLNVEVL
jgi:hypothetical protein